MNENYLDELPLPAGVKAKIARLGVPNAAALVAMIQAAPEEFAEYIGPGQPRASDGPAGSASQRSGAHGSGRAYAAASGDGRDFGEESAGFERAEL